MIVRGKMYKTRDGKDVRIYSTDAGGQFPIHGAVLTPSGCWVCHSWDSDGSFFGKGPGSENNCDLVEVKPKRTVKKTLWIAEYTDGTPAACFNKRPAFWPTQFGVKEHTIEVEIEEGEGLDSAT